MPELMSAAVLDRPFSIEVKQVNRPVPKPDEALVKVYCIGICGSDIHYYEFGKIGRYEVKKPIILGHELAGEVVEIGEEVKNVAVGDRVAVEPGVTCGRCDYCKSGRYNLCPEVKFMATPPIDGAWAEYVAVRSDFLFQLPDELSFEEGALLEPLSVGFHAMRKGKVGPGDSVLVQGLGPIGQLAVQSAKLFGATKVFASDVVPFRRELALGMGADTVLDPLADDVGQKLDTLTSGNGVDVIVETSGNSKAISSTIKTVKRGGRIVFVGLPREDEIPIDISHLVDSELEIHGVFRYANTYLAAIQALKNSELDSKKIITHRFPLQKIKEAVELSRTQKDISIKTMIYPQGRNE